MKIVTLAPALAALTMLAACGGPEGDFEEAINKQLANNPECWGISSNREVTFPLKVQAGIFNDGPGPILTGLKDAGLIDLDIRGDKWKTTYHIDLTDKGEKANLWTQGEGFCVGTPKVEEIVRYTYADQGANENAASVEYTWRLHDLPDWVDRNKFSGVEGMVKPETGSRSVQKSSDGWHAGW